MVQLILRLLNKATRYVPLRVAQSIGNPNATACAVHIGARCNERAYGQDRSTRIRITVLRESLLLPMAVLGFRILVMTHGLVISVEKTMMPKPNVVVDAKGGEEESGGLHIILHR